MSRKEIEIAARDAFVARDMRARMRAEQLARRNGFDAVVPEVESPPLPQRYCLLVTPLMGRWLRIARFTHARAGHAAFA